MNSKKLIPALCLLTAFLVSCGNEPAQTPADSVSSQAETETAAVTVYPAYVSDLPDDYDLGGYEFVVLKQDLGQSSWQWNVFAPEEENGDLQNDACYRRTSSVCEKYNCVIREEINASPIGMLKKLAASGDASYSAGFDSMAQLPNASDGSFYNLYTLPNLNLEKAYWNQNMIHALTVRDTLYVVGGDILITDDECIEMTLYNRGLANDLDMENLYDAVKNGTWTFDKMVALMKQVVTDLNGDGKFDENDRMGLLYADNADAQPYFAGARTQLFKITNGEPEFTGNNERAAKIFSIMNDVFANQAMTLNWSVIPGYTGATMASLIDNKQILFENMCLSLVRRFCRDVEVNFGLLPIPKLDEAQEQYATCIHSETHGVWVPVSVSDPEKVGFILEALAAASTNMSDVYYNVCMASKYTRDAESYDMVRLSLDNIIIDPGFVFNWGGLGRSVTVGIASSSGEYSSLLASSQSAAEEAMNKFLASLEDKN